MSGSTAPAQPDVWTFVDFEVPDALIDALLPDDGWYADYQSAPEHVVVFAGRPFRYRKGDARAEVVAFGLAAGTSEHQLDRGD